MLPYYSKNLLLPFSEYIPGEKIFPKLRDWFPDLGNYKNEQGPYLLKLKDYKYSAQICYDALFSKLSRYQAVAGAQFIIMLSNDSWNGTLQEPYQHMYIALARSIEVAVL